MPRPHTPGPWTVHPFNAHVCPLDDMNTPIASMLWPTVDRSEEETFANAALIAAAPALLAALEKIANHDRDVTGGPEMVAIASEALALARTA